MLRPSIATRDPAGGSTIKTAPKPTRTSFAPLAARMRTGLRKGEPRSLLAVMERPPTLIQPNWEPANHTSTFGTPHTAMSSESYIAALERRLAEVVATLEAEYDTMPERVYREREAKGLVMRDIAEMKQALAAAETCNGAAAC